MTGGGTGIGYACAERLVHDGWDVVVVGRRQHVLDRAVEALGDRASAVRADVTDPSDVARLADEVGAVDAHVCCAGGAVAGAGEGPERTASTWSRTYAANVLSAVLVTEALLPLMPRPGGRIVAISSVSGRKGPGAYGAAKAALKDTGR